MYNEIDFDEFLIQKFDIVDFDVEKLKSLLWYLHLNINDNISINESANEIRTPQWNYLALNSSEREGYFYDAIKNYFEVDWISKHEIIYKQNSYWDVEITTNLYFHVNYDAWNWLSSYDWVEIEINWFYFYKL